MKKLYIGLLICFSTVVVEAQQYSSKVWHFGEILTKDSSIQRGKLYYSFDEEYVHLQSPVKQKVFHPKDIIEFRFTDSLTNRYRIVRTMHYQSSNGFDMPGFFEILLDSNVFLLKREYISSYVTTDGISGFATHREVEEFDYFYKDNEKLKFLNTRPKKIYIIFGTYAGQMKVYIKQNRLHTYSEKDLIQIMKYYNELLSI